MCSQVSSIDNGLAFGAGGCESEPRQCQSRAAKAIFLSELCTFC